MTAIATTHYAWHKATDQHVHLRLVQMPGLCTIELRDWNESLERYGRGVWFEETPATRDMLSRAARTPELAPIGGVPPVDSGVLATVMQAPGSVVHLRVIEVDGTPALEFREFRNGENQRGYWIPYNAIAEQILLSARAHDLKRSAA